MITRREFNGGSLAAAATLFTTSCQTERPLKIATTTISVVLRVFIPSPAVSWPRGTPGATLNFNGGEKVIFGASIDLDSMGPGALTIVERRFGRTLQYADSGVRPVSGKPDWWSEIVPNAPVIASAQLEMVDDRLNGTWRANEGTHGVRILVNAWNPLIPTTVSPSIDAEFILSLRRHQGQIQFKLAGEHDGFPNYQLRLGPRVIYAYDCVAKSKTPWHLTPPMDETARVGWQSV